MLDAVFIVCILWFVFLFILAWFSAFNWLIEDRMFPKEMSVWDYLKAFATTPIVVSMILVEGIVKKILDFFCKAAR